MKLVIDNSFAAGNHEIFYVYDISYIESLYFITLLLMLETDYL